VSSRITTGMLQRNVLADLNRSTQRLTHTQGKLTSGKELTRPSDDPAAVSKALMLREALGGTQQHQRNAGDGLSWADATESALSTMTDVVQRARALIVQGSSDSVDATARDAIAKEIDQLAESLKEQANTSFAGRFLFAGTETTTAPYGTTDAYRGNGGRIARELGPGVSLAVNTTADEMLGNGPASGDDKLLHVLRDVRDHLVAGNGASLRGTDLARLDAGLNHLLTVRATNGAVTNRLEHAMARLQTIEEMSQKAVSDTEDADMARTLIDLNTQASAYQAALKGGAGIVQASLMDFLR
jgi:flagellar hook-associated protein 3 FlgL